MIDDKWSWGVRGIYRKLHNAIDDMEITSNGILCDGEPGRRLRHGQPGRGRSPSSPTPTATARTTRYVNIDTSKAGWAMFDDDGNYVGERGYAKPKRDLQGARVHDRSRLGRPLVAERRRTRCPRARATPKAR